MPLDGITCQLLADDLNKSLSGSRIDKIFMPDRHSIVLHIKTQEGVKKLLICADPSLPRIMITDDVKDNPALPPSFCMLLRKYIAGARITSVTDPGYERVIEICCSNTDELRDVKDYRLIVELMGRFSNIILVNGSGKILDSSIHVDFDVSKLREVMPARVYSYPPAQNKISVEEALEMVKRGELPVIDDERSRPVGKAIINSIKGMSPILSRQLCLQSDADERQTISLLGEEAKKRLLSRLESFLTEIAERTYTPRVFFDECNIPVEFAPMELSGYSSSKEMTSISDAISLYYDSKFTEMDLESGKHRLRQITDSALSKIIKKKEVHEADSEEGAKADQYKHYGDVILTYKYMIKPQDTVLNTEDYTTDPPSVISIPLDPSLDASGNAQEYYKRFRKAKRKAEMSEEYIKEDDLAIMYLRSVKTAIDAAVTHEDLDAINEEIKAEVSGSHAVRSVSRQSSGDPNRMVGIAKSGKASSRALREAAKRANAKKNNKQCKNTEKALPYRRYKSADGHEIICGRSNIQNEKLTFTTASRKTDWWFHVKGLPGTHVILRPFDNEDMPSDSSILEAASLAAFFSKSIILEEHNAAEGSRAGKLKAEVDYCPVSHVKKIPGAKPGMVIYENYYSVLVDSEEPKERLS
ncbi:MAG: NFACT family protein [Clostridiales bacterium]|nr:NFACT family protein [Clostridiales bacterium]